MFRKAPVVREVKLVQNYSFMYENIVIATQASVYLLLEKRDDQFLALRFDSPHCRYGGTNDEAHDEHPLTKHGLGLYGLFEVENSPWIEEMRNANRVHPRHSDALFEGRRHYIACFKDVKFESVCREMSEIALSREDLDEIVREQLNALEA